MTISLKDIAPIKSTIRLQNLPGIELELRPINLQDEVWLQETFGDDIQNIFTEMRMKEVCRIAYNQLIDKSEFKKREVVYVDEEGNETRKFVGGVDLLLSLIVGMDEKIMIYKALIETLGISRPLVSEEEKKNSLNPQTGQ